MCWCSSSPQKSKRRCELGRSLQRNWADLPVLILSCVLEKLRWEEDSLRFGATCAPWRSAFIQYPKKHSSPPFLLIPPFVDWPNNQRPKPGFEIVGREGKFEEMRSLYSISKKKVCDFQFRLPRNRFAVGSSLGWLVTMKPKRYGIGQVKYYARLENPFLPHADHIYLPQLPFHDNHIHAEQGPYTYILKAALSSPPDTNLNKNFILMLIVSQGCRLAFFNPATKHFCWTPVGDWDNYRSPQFSDVIYFEKTHQFYALLRHSGAVYAIDIQDHDPPTLTLVAPPTDGIRCYLNRYIVESSSGDLLQLIKVPQGHVGSTTTRPWTIKFQVLKFDSAMGSWLHIHNIGDAAFFVGANSTISRQASHFPNCKPNCIYFTNEYNIHCTDIIRCESDQDSGIYNLEDASVQSHYSVCSNKSFIAPIWLEPTSKK